MKITGLAIYYNIVCERKLWYYLNDFGMETYNEDVAIGRMIDEESYRDKRKHINIENTINIDFIEATGIIHEVKKSRAIEEASIWQVKYYLYFLERREVFNIKAKIDYPLLRKALIVELEDEDRRKIEKMVENIEIIAKERKPRKIKKKNICKKCAFFDFCWI